MGVSSDPDKGSACQVPRPSLGWRPRREQQTAQGIRRHSGPAPLRPRPVRSPAPRRPSEVTRASPTEKRWPGERGVWLELAPPGRQRGRRLPSRVNGHHCLRRHLGSSGCQELAPAPVPRCCPWQGPASRDRVPLAPRLINLLSPCRNAPRKCTYLGDLRLGFGSVSRGWRTGRALTRLLGPGPQTPHPAPGPRLRSGSGTYDLR